jgi:GH35 family endo-1,4-beta-xylanase
MRRLLPLFLLAALILPLGAAEDFPSGGTQAFGGDAWPSFQLVGSDLDKGSIEKVKVEGPSFAEAWRLTTKAMPSNAWALQIAAPCPVTVGMGDVLYADFWMRSVSGGAESAEGRSIFVFEQIGDPWTKSAEANLSAGREWKRFQIPFEAKLATGAKGSQVCFRMGFDPQVIEIGGFQLLAYGKKAKLSAFPKSKVTYPGRETDAAWRKNALEQIERLRKSDLRVSVVDASGRPIPDAKVEVTMLRQRFAWGTAVQAQRFVGEEPDDLAYREELLKYFNEVVFENDLKWPFWGSGPAASSGFNREWVDATFDFARKNRLSVRGHNLVWPSWRNLPGTLRSLQGDKVALTEAIRAHIFEAAGAYRGKLVDWDVVNEPYTEHDLLDLMGREVMVDWFKWAHEADPQAKLYLNEYGIFSGGGLDRAHQDDFFRNLSFLKEKGAPIHGLGIQSHLGGNYTSPERLLSILDRFGSLGLAIKITEMDMDAPADPQLGYDYMRDYLITLFSHPSVEGFLMWGFWDGAHWHSDAPLLTKDWELKPAGKAYLEMVRGVWWTNGQGKTDERGLYVFRGIQGDYRLKVSGKGGKATRDVTLAPGGEQCPVTLR